MRRTTILALITCLAGLTAPDPGAAQEAAPQAAIHVPFADEFQIAAQASIRSNPRLECDCQMTFMRGKGADRAQRLSPGRSDRGMLG